MSDWAYWEYDCETERLNAMQTCTIVSFEGAIGDAPSDLLNAMISRPGDDGEV